MNKNPILFTLCLLLFSHFSNASTIVASSLGFNSTDATSSLQGAIDSGNDTVIIDLQASDWITQPLFIDSISGLVVIFEPGVHVVAKAGDFPGLNDNLIMITASENITLSGYGAVMRMLKSEYVTGEWRHCLSIKNSSYINIYGLELNDSGGDGLYLADQGGAANFCRNIHVKNCRMNNNKRQGLSIVSADSVLVEHCEMTNTNGTSPEAGIDLEPDSPPQRISNIVIRNCRLTGNQGPGLMVNSKYMDGTSVPVSVVIEKCYIGGNREAQLYLNGDTVEASGNVTVNSCLIENSSFPGVFFEKPSSDFFLTMNDCVIKNTADTALIYYSPITFQTFVGAQNTTDYGGAAFFNCLVIYDRNRPYLQCLDFGLPPGSADISGNFTVINPFIQPPVFGSSPQNINVTEIFHTGYPLKTVTIATDDNIAFEGETDAAGFEITRNGNDSFPLAVSYQTTGTATNRTDYSFLPGFVVIPAYSLSSDDSLRAVADLLADSPEEAHLRIIPDSAYIISGPDSAVIWIDPASPGISEYEPDIKVKPNPGSGIFEITFEDASGGLAIIYDSHGRVMQKRKILTGRSQVVIDLVNEPAGIYHCVITTSSYTVNVKLVKVI